MTHSEQEFYAFRAWVEKTYEVLSLQRIALSLWTFSNFDTKIAGRYWWELDFYNDYASAGYPGSGQEDPETLSYDDIVASTTIGIEDKANLIFTNYRGRFSEWLITPDGINYMQYYGKIDPETGFTILPVGITVDNTGKQVGDAILPPETPVKPFPTAPPRAGYHWEWSEAQQEWVEEPGEVLGGVVVPPSFPTDPPPSGYHWAYDSDTNTWIPVYGTAPGEEDREITRPTTPNTPGYEWWWDGKQWVEVPAEEERPPFPTEPPPAGYHWEYDPNRNEWIPVLGEVEKPTPGVGEPQLSMPTTPPPAGYHWEWNEAENEWQLEVGYPPTEPGKEPITPVQQAQIDAEKQRLAQEQAQWAGLSGWQQAQITMFNKPYEQLTLAEKRQFGLDEAKFEEAKRQWNAEFGLQQQEQQWKKEQLLAQKASQPISWLEYNLLAKKPSVVQPWMQPLMWGQYQGMQPGEVIPGSTLPTAPTPPVAPTQPTAPTTPTPPTGQPTAGAPIQGQPLGAAPMGQPMAAPIPPPTDYEAWQADYQAKQQQWIQGVISQLQAHWATSGATPEQQQAYLDQLWAGYAATDYPSIYAGLQVDYEREKWAYDQQQQQRQQQPTQQQLWQGGQPPGEFYGGPYIEDPQEAAFRRQMEAHKQQMATYEQQQRDYEEQMAKGLTGMPGLLRPSRQYQARIGPTAEQMYYGYEQARTGARPEEQSWRLWSQAPPTGRVRPTFAR